MESVTTSLTSLKRSVQGGLLSRDVTSADEALALRMRRFKQKFEKARHGSPRDQHSFLCQVKVI